jgi:hypothetical protein
MLALKLITMNGEEVLHCEYRVALKGGETRQKDAMTQRHKQ